jgi:hypothetical protein
MNAETIDELTTEAARFEGTLKRLVALIGGIVAVASVASSITVVLFKITSIDHNVTELSKAVASLIEWQSAEVRLQAKRVDQADKVRELCESGKLKSVDCEEAASRGAVNRMKQ